ncbi:MarR family winged helix-turn-helix transcriptional regulator [Moorena producens]|uniref:MarR family winged helix-turn-helix transcriptional regulator n=1 Tax=Moorena producens TaxID=1155739 RepID=UPI003C73177A
MQLSTTQLNPDQCTCFNLRKATRVVTQIFDDKLRPSGLRATQFSILAVMAGAKSSTINKLAQTLAMDRTTLTRNLKPLEKQGLIEISPGEDRRTRLVALTAKGQENLTQALPLWEQAQTEVIEKLGVGPWHNLLERLTETVSIA